MVFYLVPLWLLAVSVHLLGSTIISGGEWSVKNSGSRKILVESYGSRSLVVLAAMCVSQSVFFFIQSCLGVSIMIFPKAPSPGSFVYLFLLITSFGHWILNFNEATYKFTRKRQS